MKTSLFAFIVVAFVVSILLFVSCNNTLLSNFSGIIKIRLACQSNMWRLYGYFFDANPYMPPYKPLNPILVLNYGRSGYTYLLYGTFRNFDRNTSELVVYDYDHNKYVIKLVSNIDYYYNNKSTLVGNSSNERINISQLVGSENIEILWNDVRVLKDINRSIRESRTIDMSDHKIANLRRLTSYISK